MSDSKKNTLPSKDFIWSPRREIHCIRREQILAKYPQVRSLYGHCPMTKYKVLLVVFLQILGSFYVSNKSWPVLFFLAYVVSGTFNHMMTLALHELSHNLAFKNRIPNRWLAIIANLPLCLPAAVTFKRYHVDHHKYLGEDQIDVDVPTVREAKFFVTTPRKIVWMLLQPGFYALRPLIMNPKNPIPWEIVNLVICACFDVSIYYLCGIKGISYLLLGSYLGLSLHPVAGHFIAEHYLYNDEQETYSYYGPLNWLSLNAGYHNEHHDFPYIAASRLQELREMAPEFYDTIACHESWAKVLWNYITNPIMTPYSRMKRVTLTNEELIELRNRTKNM